MDRLIIKSILYRIFSFALFGLTLMAFGQPMALAMKMSVIGTIVATIYYYVFERIWEKWFADQRLTKNS